MDRPQDQPKPDKPEAPPPGAEAGRLFWWSFWALLVLWAWQGIFGPGAETVPYSRFLKHLAAGELVACKVRDGDLLGRLKTPEGKPPVWIHTVRVADPDLVERLEAAGVEYRGEQRSVLGALFLDFVLPIGLLMVFWTVLMRGMAARAGAGILGIGRSPARLVAEAGPRIGFAQVAGCDEAKAELQEVVDFLGDPVRYGKLGARIPHGVLLVGPPGTGKTLLGRAVAGEAGVTFFHISGSDFVEMFVGVGASRVRDMFAQAKKQCPCIIFIDEIDAIGRQRGVRIGTVNDEREQTLNQLLVELDGFEGHESVIVLAATNRPDVLDAALLRPGRFDRRVTVDLPDRSGRLAILKVHAEGKPLGADVDLEELAAATPGFSGADLANLVNEGALLAARRRASEIVQDDLREAVDRVIAGPERRTRRLGDDERRRVAFHEVGHALVGHFSQHADPVRKITIIPRGRAALGFTVQLPDEDRYLTTRSQLLDRITGALGGRAAEELIFQEVSTGAENDLQVATALARQMVCRFGMGESVGLTHCAAPEGLESFLPGAAGGARDCSEGTARDIDQEVKGLLEAAYGRARDLLCERRALLERVAEALLEAETLEREDFLRLVQG